MPADSKSSCCKERVILIVFSIVLTLVVLGSGVGITFHFTEEYLEIINSDVDDSFDFLNQSCTIVGFDGNEEERRDGDGIKICEDIYFYNFTFIGSSDVFTSVEDPIFRNIGSCLGMPQPPRFNLSEVVDCWEPLDLSSLPSFYKCGNEECIKVLDPQRDLTGNGNNALLWLAFGGFIIAAGIVLAVAAILIPLCSPKDELEVALEIRH